ncbi:tetratricopeptide repeat protein [Candidatus Protochlamydia sp. W-9]|uniref:tetratricopeptide repeat protein n=1 Tax=Candidatus Protochlamydia sp. W-9 TaxID=1785087 RepID=UPI00096A87FE|nr:tetratricopeptide repeat protein [Candidatus Protochlamydia sp. W-9]
MQKNYAFEIHKAFKTLFSVGFGLFFETVREDWKSLWNGRKNKVIYSSSPFLATKILVKQGNATTQYKLGVMYLEGKGTIQSHQKAVKYYQLAAKQGNASAQYILGTLYAHGMHMVCTWTRCSTILPKKF